MGFKKISLTEYLKLHKKQNPHCNITEAKKQLNQTLKDYQNGIKCTCGNDIWVIGSAFVGNSCFTCITGESYPTDDYEIDIAMHKRTPVKGRRHIDQIDPMEINGYFDDDGYEINMDLVPKPDLCITCVHEDDPNTEIICNLTRCDDYGNGPFICHDYRNRNA